MVRSLSLVIVILAIVCVATGSASTVKALDQESNLVEILDPGHASGPFQNGDIVQVVVTVRNLSNESQLFFVGLSFRGPDGVLWDISPRAILLKGELVGSC